MTMGKISEKFIQLLQDMEVSKNCVTGTQKPEFCLAFVRVFRPSSSQMVNIPSRAQWIRKRNVILRLGRRRPIVQFLPLFGLHFMV